MKTFKQVLQDESFVVTAELALRDGDGPKEIRQQGEILHDSVSAVQVADHPFQPGQISALAAATILVRHGMDAISEFNGRDRNRIALMSDLLGLRALGINTVVIGEGHRGLPDPDNPARTVQEVDCRALISMAESLNEDDSINPDEAFLIGTQTAVDPARTDAIVTDLAARSTAGARLLQLQPCFDTIVLRDFMQRLVEARLTWSYAVMVSLAPLPSVEAALRLREELPGCIIPSAVLKRLDSAADSRLEGIAICTELIREVKTIPGVAGIRLITMGDSQRTLDAIRESRE